MLATSSQFPHSIRSLTSTLECPDAKSTLFRMSTNSADVPQVPSGWPNQHGTLDESRPRTFFNSIERHRGTLSTPPYPTTGSAANGLKGDPDHNQPALRGRDFGQSAGAQDGTPSSSQLVTLGSSGFQHIANASPHRLQVLSVGQRDDKPPVDSECETPIEPRSATFPDDDDCMDESEVEDTLPDTATQTASERMRARRKMKRFRLTHQQTRFLMSEFAKQPHPDAEHRTRLSQEIPGLSPRQVQVWFQNRRAKIKRLTSDDRDRMLRMRAVPETFDNLQALHSPYGSMHGVPAALTTSPEFPNQAFANHLHRPGMTDVQRLQGESQTSPIAMSSFGSVPYNAGHGSIIPPLSTNLGHHERFAYGGPLSAPLTAGSRGYGVFSPTQTFEAGSPLGRQNRAAVSFHQGEPLSRSSSDSSPLVQRPGVAWKPASIDYTAFDSSVDNSRRDKQSLSQHHEQQDGSLGGVGGSAVPKHTAIASPDETSFSHDFPGRPRLRTASTSSHLNYGSPYRHHTSPFAPSQENTSGYSIQGYGGHYQSPPLYTTSFPSAPLAAPSEYTQVSPIAEHQVDEKPRSQMSAPLVPPGDFSDAFRGMGESDVARRSTDGLGIAHQGYQNTQRGLPQPLPAARGVESPRLQGFPASHRPLERGDLGQQRTFDRPG